MAEPVIERAVVRPLHPVGSPGGGPPPPAEGAYDQTRTAAREQAFSNLAGELAALEGPESGDAPAEPAGDAPAEHDAKPPKNGKAKQAADPAEEGESSAAADEAPEDESQPTPTAPKKPADRDLERRLSAVRAEQKRAREAIAAERRAFQDEIRSLEPELRELRAFRAAKERARVDPGSVLQALGLGDGDWKAASELIYARSPEGRNDPRFADRAARTLAQRQQEDALSVANRRIEELENRINARENETTVSDYLDSVLEHPLDEAPLVARMLEADRRGVRAALRDKARELLQLGDGEVPEAADVIAALEDDERAALARRGIDWEAVLAAPAVKTTKPRTMPPAAKPKPAKSPQSPPQRAPAGPPLRSREEQREEDWQSVIRDLRSGKLE